MALPPAMTGLMTPPPTSAPDGEDGLRPVDLDALRRLRSELLAFQAFLGNVRKGQSKIQTFCGYVQQMRQDTAALMGEIQGGDDIAQIHNLWDQMKDNPLMVMPEEEHESQQQLHYLDMLDAQIRQIVFLTGYLTIPERLNEWLAQAWPGYYVPFHVVFEDELPLLEDRQKVLNYLAWSPQVIKGGIVDPASGLIYRYSESLGKRLLSVLYLLLGLAGSVLVVWASTAVQFEGWMVSRENFPRLLVGWLAVLVGIVVHAAVGSAKRAQSQGSLPPIMAMRNLLLVIDARNGQFLMKILLGLIGFFALLFSSGVENITPLNTFLVGYALDSFIELFGASLEQRAAAQTTVLKQQISGTK